MKIICPIRPQNFKDYLFLLEKINNRADIIEIWLDQITDIPNFLMKFSKQKISGPKYLAVCKRANEKGTFTGSSADRVEILKQFIEASNDLIDLDITKNLNSEIKKIPSKNLILSFHDFENIPKNLENIFQEMKNFKPLIYKFAVTTNTKKDLNVFLEFIKNFPKDKKAIFTTMGKYGQLGRVKIGEKSWGQFFALDKNSATASGQQTL